MPSRAATPPLPHIKQGDRAPANELNATVKLNRLARRFEGFEDALVMTKQKRRDENEERFAEVHKLIVDLKTSLALEAKNRAISVTAVQSWLSDRIEQWTEEVQTPLLRKLAALDVRLDEVNVRLDKLEEEHALDRKTFPALIDARAQELLEQIKDMRAAHELNVKQREEREHRILVKVQQQSDRFAEQFAAEKLMKEEQIKQIRVEIERECDVRVKGIVAVREIITKEFIDVKASIDVERQERVQQHKEVLVNIEHYIAAVQDTVKIVGLDTPAVEEEEEETN